MESRLVMLLLLGAVVSVSSYPDSVPPTSAVCRTMTPGHGPKPKTSEPICKVFSSHDAVKSGSQIEVTISAVDPAKPFRGYYLQARDQNQNQIGTFRASPNTKVHSCGGIKATGAHHSSRDEKKSVTVLWTAPANYAGRVIFYASCLQNFDNFWVQLKSPPVEIQA